MEQMYLIEIFVDKVVVYTDTASTSSADKNLILKIGFGPKVTLIMKEGQLAANDDRKDDIVEMNVQMHRQQWSRTIRIGKSYLFPSYPDTILAMLSKFPLELEVWNDDEKEIQEYVGIGTLVWNKRFYHYLKESADVSQLHEPFTLKESTILYQECCCGPAGEVHFILRLSALGQTIITEFQETQKDPLKFCFRTDKTPNMFDCKKIEGDDINFCMVGSIYETTTLEDPDMNAQDHVEICTELDPCGGPPAGALCIFDDPKAPPKKKYTVEKIRIGDISGPCGNFNCPLAHKIRTYVRNLEAYKAKAKKLPQKPEGSKKICGDCVCKDETWHRKSCPEYNKSTEPKPPCSGCIKDGEENVCDEKDSKHKTASDKSSNVHYVTEVPDYKNAMYMNYIGGSYSTTCCSDVGGKSSKSKSIAVTADRDVGLNSSRSSNTFGCNPWIYNVEIPSMSKSQQFAIYNATTTGPDPFADCRCNPPKPSPPCKTFDCSCLTEITNMASRKKHRSFCPLFKHKVTCPVNKKEREEREEENKGDDDEEETVPLPYGLPPIQLGPCPVIGRPCSVPDGFTRLYRNAALPALPPSYSEAGKVCCSKEFNRIKKAIKEYMQQKIEQDLRCVNTFNVDTEKRCCDTEQVLKSLAGRECCGAHKMAIYPDPKEKAKEKEKEKKK